MLLSSQAAIFWNTPNNGQGGICFTAYVSAFMPKQKQMDKGGGAVNLIKRPGEIGLADEGEGKEGECKMQTRGGYRVHARPFVPRQSGENGGINHSLAELCFSPPLF